ncbi:gamma-glutamylcyclotransferase family protein [Paenibacillus thermotolerans]|uniref:gamma-glutamylcyclotransferase family protein n=1 Tax=Paenibacillus thermotolerans TaxID=3027807 RepID=UPI0023681695|nr:MULTISPECIES: gamma-glutamylcyclotransferase family protein [unclassified Paenibacillus]
MIRVFVYGTLLTGGSAYGKIASFVRSASPGAVRASLVSAGEYPAMILGSGVVRGEWLECEEAALAVMDEWEDYYGPGDPRNGYERVMVTDLDGTRSGLAYVWCDDRGCPPIPGGSWRDHLAGKQ